MGSILGVFYLRSSPLDAVAKAGGARNLGNLVHSCRWQQIKRLIIPMSADRAIGTVH